MSTNPDWAKGPGAGRPAAAAPGAPQGQQPAAPPKQSIKDWSADKVIAVMRIGNFFNGVAMIVGAILQLFTGVVGLDFQVLLLSIYITFFGLMLMCAECHLGFLDKGIRKFFGFLYSFLGRTCFILFAASINFAMDSWVGYVVGIGTLFNALFNFYVIKFHPGFKAAGYGAAGDPYSTYTGGDEAMKVYLKNHPELTRKAMSAGISVAQQNPAVAQQVVAAAAGAAVSNAKRPSSSGAGAGAGGRNASSDNPFDPPV